MQNPAIGTKSANSGSVGTAGAQPTRVPGVETPCSGSRNPPSRVDRRDLLPGHRAMTSLPFVHTNRSSATPNACSSRRMVANVGLAPGVSSFWYAC